MKRVRLFLGFFFITALLFGGCTERVLKKELTKEGGLYYYNGEPFSGVAFQMQNESFMSVEENIKKGIIRRRVFYENGTIQGEIEFNEHKRKHGKGIIWDENGKIVLEIEWNDGVQMPGDYDNHGVPIGFGY